MTTLELNQAPLVVQRERRNFATYSSWLLLAVLGAVLAAYALCQPSTAVMLVEGQDQWLLVMLHWILRVNALWYTALTLATGGVVCGAMAVIKRRYRDGFVLTLVVMAHLSIAYVIVSGLIAQS